MTDRELLELAAKAANIEYQRTDDGEVIEYFGGGLQLPFDGGKWNPLTDDGDALRLAVKLGFVVETPKYTGFGTTCGNQTVFLDDPLEQTRHAIVRYSAEIGKQIP